KSARAETIKKTNGRRTTVYMRYVIVGTFVLLALLGVKSVVVPSDNSSPSAIVAAFQQKTETTSFPATRAEGFVLAFTKTYFNRTAKVSNPDLSAYATEEAMKVGGVILPRGDFLVTEGPYVFDIRYDSDVTATYTVGLRLNNGGM